MILRYWKILSQLPGGSWLFSRAVGWVIPYTGSMKAHVLSIEPGFARVKLNDRRSVRNHLKSIHAIALANLGEFTTGIALHSLLEKNQQAILVHFEIDYLKKARGDIFGESQIASASEGSISIEASLSDKSGELVAKVRAVWKVRTNVFAKTN